VLKDRGQDLRPKDPIFTLEVFELPAKHFQHGSRIALTTARLVTRVVLAMDILKAELVDDPDILNGDIPDKGLQCGT
jgi:hypothetical protein